MPRVWFDRLNRYRLAAFILVIPLFLNILGTDLGWLDTPLLLRRVIYWIGLAILLWAVAMDTWSVYSGKRKVRKMIKEKKVDH